MSKDDEQLFWFSVAFILVMVIAVVVPYLKRKRDLFTSWNLFLGGSCLFVGLSGIYMTGKQHIFDYTSREYELYYFAIVLFYVIIFLTYHFNKWPVRVAQRHFLTWPTMTPATLITISIVAMVASLGQFVLSFIPGVAQLVSRMGLVAPTFAVVFILTAWFMNKRSLFPIFLLIVIAGIAFYSAFSMGGGRRLLYGTAFAFPLCIYWYILRPWRSTTVLILLFFLAIGTAYADHFYGQVRWYGVRFGGVTLDRKEGASERWTRFLKKLGDPTELSDFAKIGQQGTEHSFIAIRMYALKEGGTFKKSPLHALKVLLTFPVPRAIWEGKPKHLGLTLPFDSGVLEPGTRTNWGTSIVGHAYHEGVWVVPIYAILAGLALRYIDSLLVLQPGNPFLLAFLAAASGHIIGWSRGDISTFTVWPLLCFLLMMLFRLVLQPVLGKRPYSANAIT